ncbi:MAG: glycosyltransferase family 39 protein [Patescibacteria group bacterium]
MVKKLLRLLQTNLVLILICLLFLVNRLYKISEIPSSVYWDEASIGYNAYSVLTTGKDEWGETLPLHFRAFGEFKLPVYIYSVVVSEFIFGVNAFAVRFPSVVFGLLSIIGLYFLTLELTKKKSISLLGSFIFSITPWFFIFSRTGYEAVAGLAFFIWAIYFLLRSINEKKYLLLSTLLFIVSAYSYNSFRILTSIVLGLGLMYSLYRKQFVIVLLSGLMLISSALPLYKLYKQDSGLSRLQAVGSSAVVSNYFKNFSPSYLFISGDTNPRSQVPDKSQLYIIDAVFLILGIIYIMRSNNSKLYYILGLLLLAPIPAAITKENPHALRSILMSPMLSIISAFGIYHISKLNKYLLWVIIGIYTAFFINYFYNFVTEYNSLSKSAWQYEYKEIFEKQKEGCVSDQFGQPYIFALYYNKVDPNYFISTRVLNPVNDWGFSTVKSFGNYTFEKICGKTN